MANNSNLPPRKFEIYDRVNVWNTTIVGPFSNKFERTMERGKGMIRGYCITQDGRGWEYFVIMDQDGWSYWAREAGLDKMREDNG